ncbi:hypothetical protein [Amycolatopsis dongchuanensis]|uniref:Translation initiation factor IF-2 n=1 Tax=Amycolatopsis dongchuanensis TaxID=1070866 RepID=A0ABP8VL88_9PSEU
MVTDDVQRLKAAMAGLVREQADRHALHQRQAVEIKAEAHEYMTKQAQAAERYLQHRRELGRREAEEERPDSVQELDFEPEGFAESEADEETVPPPPPPAPPAPPQAAPPPPPPAPVPRRSTRARASELDEDDDDDFLNNRWRDE